MRRFRTYAEVDEPAGAEVPAQVASQVRRLRDRLQAVDAVWLVASGKGGVGKSAITANLAAALARDGHAVGALDADLNGPSLARMLDARKLPLDGDGDGIRPATGAAGARVMSMDLLLDAEDAPVRWREPAGFGFVWQSALETGALREFLADVDWGALDFLLLDLPPGTDKLARAFELVPEPSGVLLVTTPSEAARAVVARSLRMVRRTRAGQVGLVANMTGHVCAACGHHEPLFLADGARRLALESDAEIWAEIPFSPRLARETDAGRPPVLEAPDDPAAASLLALARRVAAATSRSPDRATGSHDTTPPAEETP
jgi:ATP-binding protein involved in chromosome partitioning